MDSTIPELRERHRAEERALIRAALEAHSWNVVRAAGSIDVASSWLRRYVAADEELRALYKQHGLGRGRPVTPPAQP